MTTSHYSIAVGNRGVFGKNNGSSGSGQTTGFTVQNLRAARHNGQSKQINLQRFGRFKGFRMSEIFHSSITLQGGSVSPCKEDSHAFLRHWIWSSLSRVLWAPKAHHWHVFPHLCRAFVRQGVCVLLLRHPLTVPLRRCETIDMETSLPTILQCAPLPTLQCDSRNYYSKLLAQGPEHNKRVKKHK